MVKTFKKIAALALALALVVCFAVSASAVTVTTTTQYVSTSDTSNVKVNVTVQGDEIANKEVTYYAYNDDGAVYIDQTTATGTTATFSFQTTAYNLKSDVKVGYTGGADAEPAEIDGYTVASTKGTVNPDIIPDSGNATVTISEYTPETGFAFKDVDVDGATLVGTAAYNETAGTITVVLSGANDDVTITVNEEEESSSTEATATSLDAGYKADAEAGTRTITVLGAASDAKEFGVIITTETIAESYATEDAFNAALKAGKDYFKAELKGTNGVFAVQVIDEGAESEAFFTVGETYHTAIYAKNYDGSYKIAAVEDIIVG